MNELMKLSREAQIMLGGAALLVILSFLDWQQYCVGDVCSSGIDEWYGIGTFAALSAIALLVWEVARMLGKRIQIGDFAPALISVALGIAVCVLTAITFLSHNDFRKWPAWLALIVSIVVAIVAVQRGREEGVEMPKMASPGGTSGGPTSEGGGSTTATPSTSADDSGSSAEAGDGGGDRPQAT